MDDFNIELTLSYTATCISLREFPNIMGCCLQLFMFQLLMSIMLSNKLAEEYCKYGDIVVNRFGKDVSDSST